MTPSKRYILQGILILALYNCCSISPAIDLNSANILHDNKLSPLLTLRLLDNSTLWKNTSSLKIELIAKELSSVNNPDYGAQTADLGFPANDLKGALLRLLVDNEDGPQGEYILPEFKEILLIGGTPDELDSILRILANRFGKFPSVAHVVNPLFRVYKGFVYAHEEFAAKFPTLHSIKIYSIEGKNIVKHIDPTIADITLAFSASIFQDDVMGGSEQIRTASSIWQVLSPGAIFVVVGDRAPWRTDFMKKIDPREISFSDPDLGAYVKHSSLPHENRSLLYSSI